MIELLGFGSVPLSSYMPTVDDWKFVDVTTVDDWKPQKKHNYMILFYIVKDTKIVHTEEGLGKDSSVVGNDIEKLLLSSSLGPIGSLTHFDDLKTSPSDIMCLNISPSDIM